MFLTKYVQQCGNTGKKTSVKVPVYMWTKHRCDICLDVVGNGGILVDSDYWRLFLIAKISKQHFRHFSVDKISLICWLPACFWQVRCQHDLNSYQTCINSWFIQPSAIFQTRANVTSEKVLCQKPVGVSGYPVSKILENFGEVKGFLSLL